MQPHRSWLWLVEEISGHGLAHVGAQIFPGFALGENVVRKALGHIAAVALLRDAEDNLHGATIALEGGQNKP